MPLSGVAVSQEAVDRVRALASGRLVFMDDVGPAGDTLEAERKSIEAVDLFLAEVFHKEVDETDLMGMGYALWEKPLFGLSPQAFADTRMQQRGIRKKDVEPVLEYGTPVEENAYILRRQDVDREIELRKREIKALSGLRDRDLKVIVVQEDELVVTCYHSRAKVRKRALRRGSENGWFKHERRNGSDRGR